MIIRSKTLLFFTLAAIISVAIAENSQAAPGSNQVRVGENTLEWTEFITVETKDLEVRDVKLNGFKIDMRNDDLGIYPLTESENPQPIASAKTIKQQGDFLLVEYYSGGNDLTTNSGFNVFLLKPSPAYIGIYNVDKKNRIFKLEYLGVPSAASHAEYLYFSEYYKVSDGKAVLDNELTCNESNSNMKKYVADVMNRTSKKNFKYSVKTIDAYLKLYAATKLTSLCDSNSLDLINTAVKGHFASDTKSQQEWNDWKASLNIAPQKISSNKLPAPQVVTPNNATTSSQTIKDIITKGGTGQFNCAFKGKKASKLCTLVVNKELVNHPDFITWNGTPAEIDVIKIAWPDGDVSRFAWGDSGEMLNLTEKIATGYKGAGDEAAQDWSRGFVIQKNDVKQNKNTDFIRIW